MKTDNKIVILGGGIAGLYTAYRLLEKKVPGERIILVSKEWPPYSRHRLVHALHTRDVKGLFLKIKDILLEKNVRILKGYEATGLDIENNTVIVKNPNGVEERIEYDQLVLALGGKPFKPPIKGLDKTNVTTYYNIMDYKRIMGLPRGSRIAVIGGGVIGASLAALLQLRGYRVSIIEIMNYLMPGLLVEELASFIEEYLEQIGVRVYTSTKATEIVGIGRARMIITDNDTIRVDHVIVATGVRPNTDILKDTGIPMQRGAIIINDYGRVEGYENIYALGDCALSKDYISGKLVYRPLGFIAGKYAKIIASNIVGEEKKCDGIIPTIYENIGKMKIYVVGLTPTEASKLGYKYTISYQENENTKQAILKSRERIIGWQQVSPGYPYDRNKAYKYYEAIKRHAKKK